MYNMMQNYGAGYGFGFPGWAPGALVLLLLWGLFWKGLALWHSARRKQGWWFIILLLVNTVGILEIVYLFLIAKVPKSELFGSKKNS
jgi:methionyl-tRNA synthetase